MMQNKLIPLEIFQVTMRGKFSPVVLLRNEDQILPILVGLPEADAIYSALTNRDWGRPMTHDLICNVLAGLRGQLKSVVIYKLEKETFFAHLNIEQTGEEGQIERALRIDSRPSDSIAIACRLNAPIYASQDVMVQAAIDINLLQGEEDSDDDDDDDDLGDEEPRGGI